MHQLAISFTKNGLPGPDRSIVGFRINYNGLKFIRSIERPAENTQSQPILVFPVVVCLFIELAVITRFNIDSTRKKFY